MDLFLCGECFWMGFDVKLDSSENFKTKNKTLKKILEKNNFYSQRSRQCPECSSQNLFIKENDTKDTLKEFLDTPINATVPEEETEFEEFADNILKEAQVSMPRPKIKFKNKCDICGSEFESKVEATRCDECFQKLIG